jgi:hypothetical protein
MSAKPIPLPDDWYDVAPGRTQPDLSDHYGRCRDVIQRWRREHPVGLTTRGRDRYQRAERRA